MDDDPDLEPVRRFELKLLEGEMKVFVSNVYAALAGIRADNAELKTYLKSELAKQDKERAKQDKERAKLDEERARKDEERARQQNAREWRLFGALVGVIGLAVIILGLLIRLS